jgi:hypothetical protein
MPREKLTEEERKRRRRESRRKWSEKHPEVGRIKGKKRYARNPEKYREKGRASYARNLLVQRLRSIRRRCKVAGTTCTLTQEHLRSPPTCPFLGISLQVGAASGMSTSPTVDRINPNGGYTPENILFLSYRANTIKNNASAEELLRVAFGTYISRQLAGRDPYERQDIVTRIMSSLFSGDFGFDAIFEKFGFFALR